jgi:hypothetical protein
MTDDEKRAELVEYARWLIAECMNPFATQLDIYPRALARLEDMRSRWRAESA